MTAVSDVDQLLATISAEDLCTFDVGGLMNVAELDSALWRSNGFVKPGSTRTRLHVCRLFTMSHLTRQNRAAFGAVVAKLLAEGAAMREVGNNEGWYNRLVVLTNTVVDTIFRRVQPGTVVGAPRPNWTSLRRHSLVPRWVCRDSSLVAATQRRMDVNCHR